MVASVSKSYNLTPDYVLNEMSYANIILYSSVLPGYDDVKEKDKPIRGDDPKNQQLLKDLINEQ